MKFLEYNVCSHILIQYIICQAVDRHYSYIVGNKMTNLREIIAFNLKEQRKKSGFTQAQLAEKVNVSTHHIARIETARDYPRLELVARISEVLDIEVYELFINPLSHCEQLVGERLYEIIAENINQLVSEAIEKGIAKKCKKKLKYQKWLIIIIKLIFTNFCFLSIYPQPIQGAFRITPFI